MIMTQNIQFRKYECITTNMYKNIWLSEKKE